jgi:hypothetical protein
MNYLKLYIKLIRRAQIRDAIPEVIEEHHVFPESIFGKNNYKVKLSPREHYVVHALLYKGLIKRYGKNSCMARKMLYGFWRMHNQSSLNADRYINSRLYESLRKNFAESITGKNHPLYGQPRPEHVKQKLREANLGKTHSQKTKNLIRLKTHGVNNPMYGKHHSKETKKLISIKNSGENHSRFGKFGKDNPLFGKNLSDEHKLKLSKAGKGRKRFNNGVVNTMAFKPPGPEWKPGWIKIKV